MFDIGFSELLLFGVIALIVLGPEKLPQAARSAGQWYAKIRRTVSTLQSEIEAELDLAETRQQMQKELAKIRQTEAEMRREMAEMRGDMQAFEHSQNHSLTAAHDTAANDSGSKADKNSRLQNQPTRPKPLDYAYASDAQGEDTLTLPSNQVSEHCINDDGAETSGCADVIVTQAFTTKPWENMWFRLGDYDKARRLPAPPYVANYQADVLLNSLVSTQTAVKSQETD